jgi:CRP/FNR family transcriptional regulator
MATKSTELGSVSNTSCFSEENFNRLRSIMYETKAEPGTHLFWEGDAADKLYYLIKGRVKITKTSDEGRHFILYMYQEGDLFGQVDPYQDSTQGFNAEVAEASTVGVIQKKDLEVLLWQHGELAVEFMKWMGLVHRMTQTKFRDLMMFGKPGALCSTLIRLHNTYGEQRKNGGVLIGKKLTNTELADMIGATRESVNRMLADLKHAGVIANENGYLVVNDLQYLRDICHCENCPADICRI